ncbi:MAG: hypothetical protein GY749_12625 [Desulfobacteraceae bacterium]|nr:hypothetical protein [Desulfobacteraceae bacterium]
MILSFHPCFEADKNIICAGRDPGAEETAVIKAADAVILPQGCRKSLYEMATENCPHVFPNYNARFKYPGKINQVHLFRETNTPHPKTETYPTVNDFPFSHFSLPTSHFPLPTSHFPLPFSHFSLLTSHFSLPSFPFVFKFDWGGEGDNVFLIKSPAELQDALEKAAVFEKTGQKGFLIQEYIPSQNRTLRVVVMGQNIISYWRVQLSEGEEHFCSNLAKGAVIDYDSDQDLQDAAVSSARDFCGKTGINLAGFDFLFSSESCENTPLFLEINYFFGRQGLGGSEKYYELLTAEIKRWTSERM